MGHIALIGEKRPDLMDPTCQEEAGALSLGGALPPVPKKLVAKIQAGMFVDMADLLPDRLGTAGGHLAEEESPEKHFVVRLQHPKKKQVTNILEWIQCFGIYTAVVAKKDPARVQDLLGYQSLIVEAKMEYQGDGWLGYDRRFRQRAAADLGKPWSVIDPSLWSMALSGLAKATRCKHCFSLSHRADECEWAPPATSVMVQQHGPQQWRQPPPRPRFGRSPPVCHEWNNSASPVCPHPDCRYQHVCSSCYYDNHVTQKDHKVINCPKRPFKSGPLLPPKVPPMGRNRYNPY